MKFKSILLLALSLLLIVALPVLAQGETNSIAFNGVSFQFPPALASSVNVSQHAGDPVDLQAPGGPQAPYTEFLLYNDTPAPESIFDAGGIRVYRIADFASYPDYQHGADVVSSMVGGQADLTPYMAANTADSSNALPFLPIVPSNQIIRARAHYVGNDSFSGVAYITAFRQDVSPFVNNEFIYTVQGVSADGSLYVSAIFPLSTSLFPDTIPADFDMDTFVAGIDQYINDSTATLNAGLPTDFTPTLDMIDSVIASLVLTPVTSAGPLAPDQATPSLEPTTVADPTFGGLAGVWTLTSWGDPSTATLPVEGSTVTVAFGPDGISGSGGCNNYRGNFQYDNGILVIEPLVSTMMACEQAITEQETAYLSALQSANGYQLVDGNLIVYYEGGVLNFSPAATEAG
ncbi:MAG: META domain-containing protein [Anaerolineae bacterium]|nr:META domain-containing protein [Anaerolineae bacterium]